jgi:hypothetical protein
MSTSTDQTMMTMFWDEMAATRSETRDEMAANRIETQQQIAIMQHQMTTFQTLVTHLTQSLTSSPRSTNMSPHKNNTQQDNHQESHPNIDPNEEPQATNNQNKNIPETHQQPPIQFTQPTSPPRIKKVSMKDQPTTKTTPHNAPSASGDTPPPKRRSSGLNISRTTPLLPNTRSTGNRIFPPSNPNTTTIGNKANGGAS